MKESESIQNYFTRISSIINQIQSYGDIIQDKKIVEKIFRSLLENFDHVVAAPQKSLKIYQKLICIN